MWYIINIGYTIYIYYRYYKNGINITLFWKVLASEILSKM